MAKTNTAMPAARPMSLEAPTPQDTDAALPPRLCLLCPTLPPMSDWAHNNWAFGRLSASLRYLQQRGGKGVVKRGSPVSQRAVGSLRALIPYKSPYKSPYKNQQQTPLSPLYENNRRLYVPC